MSYASVLLNPLFPGLALRGDSTLLVAHYAKLSRQFGFTVPVPIAGIDGFAHFLLQIHKTDEGLRMLRFNVAHALTVPSVYAGLADRLEAAGKKTDAARAMEEALRYAERAHDTSVVGYRKRLTKFTSASRASTESTSTSPP